MFHRIPSGTKVRLLGQEVGVWTAGLKLQSDAATVIAYDRIHHLYRVQLELPAFLAKKRLWRPFGQPEAVKEVTEILWEDNQLEVQVEAEYPTNTP